MDGSLFHYGILGMRWGVRRSQAQLDKLAGRDRRWVKKQGSKITKQAYKEVTPEMKTFAKTELKDQSPVTKSGQLSKTYVNQYNQKLAQLMNQKVGDIEAPSGKVLRYVAKRGEVGVHVALADQDYNLKQVKSGVYSSGRIAYKKEVVRTD